MLTSLVHLSQLGEFVASQIPDTKFGEDGNLVIEVSAEGMNAFKYVQSIGKTVEQLLQQKTQEHILMRLFLCYLKQSHGPKFKNSRISFASWDEDLVDGVDIILEHGKQRYSIDITTNPETLGDKVCGGFRDKKAHFVVFFEYPDTFNPKHIFNMYRGDYSKQSIDSFISNKGKGLLNQIKVSVYSRHSKIQINPESLSKVSTSPIPYFLQ